MALVSFKVKTSGIYLLAPQFRMTCPTGYNVMLKIVKNLTVEYDLGAYDNTYILTPNGYCSSCYPIFMKLDGNVDYYIIGQTTYTSNIDVSSLSFACILLKKTEA